MLTVDGGPRLAAGRLLASLSSSQFFRPFALMRRGDTDEPSPDDRGVIRRETLDEFAFDGMDTLAAPHQLAFALLVEIDVLDAAVNGVGMAGKRTAALQVGNDDADGLRCKNGKPGKIGIGNAGVVRQHGQHRKLRWRYTNIRQRTLDAQPIGGCCLTQ